jgi:hypothetical protein
MTTTVGLSGPSGWQGAKALAFRKAATMLILTWGRFFCKRLARNPKEILEFLA